MVVRHDRKTTPTSELAAGDVPSRIANFPVQLAMTDSYEQSAQDSFPLSSSSGQYAQYSYDDCDDLSDDLLYSRTTDSVEDDQSLVVRDTMLLESGLDESGSPERLVTPEVQVDKRPDILKVRASLHEDAKFVVY